MLGRALDTKVNLPGMMFVAGDSELAIWTRPGHVRPPTKRLARWWQMARLGEIAIHSVHLDPNASAGRVKQLRTLTADLAADTHNMILGDFNLAPRPSDGRIGDAPSSFTSASERSAFAQLMQEHDLVDATASGESQLWAGWLRVERAKVRPRTSPSCDAASKPKHARGLRERGDLIARLDGRVARLVRTALARSDEPQHQI